MLKIIDSQGKIRFILEDDDEAPTEVTNPELELTDQDEPEDNEDE